MGLHMQAGTTVMPMFVNKNGRILWKVWKVLISSCFVAIASFHKVYYASKIHLKA